MSKETFGISREKLQKSGFMPGEGFSARGIRSFWDLLRFARLARTEGEFRSREIAEVDPSFQQLIMYAVVFNNEGDFLLYERSKGQGYNEGRLAGKVSMGVGGHMEAHDKSLTQSLYRELAEELVVWKDGKIVDLSKERRGIKDLAKVSVIGIIKDDSEPVGQVHVGVLCFVKPKNPNTEIHIRTDNGENVRSQYLNDWQYLELVRKGRVEPEGWTKIAFAMVSGLPEIDEVAG